LIIGHFEVAQGIEASFKFQLIDKMTLPHERAHRV